MDGESRSPVATLATLAGSLTFENLPDDKKGEIFMHWLATQCDETQHNFLNSAKQLVDNGITMNSNFFHYVIIGSKLTSSFLNQPYIDLLNSRLEDLIGEDQAMVTFVNHGETCVAAPIPRVHEIVAGLMVKHLMFAEGICFKLDSHGVSEPEHTPMYLDCLTEIIDAMIETVHELGEPEAIAKLILFKDMRDSDKRISFEFDIVLLDGQRRKAIYFGPK